MDVMKRLPREKISESFNAAKRDFAAYGEKSGFDVALQNISTAIGEMKDAGIDVSLEIFGDASEQAFDLFATTSVTVPISGVLRIGPIHRLFALATKSDSKNALIIGLSNYDIRFNGPDAKLADGEVTGKVRSINFDLKKDPDALVKFQQEIINHAARNAVVNDNDTAQAFDSATVMRKSVLPRPKAS
jgi:hypothetical protein